MITPMTSIQIPWKMAQARKRFMLFALIPMAWVGDYLDVWNQVYRVGE